MIEWVSVEDELPETPGKYIVRTKTTTGGQNRFDARLHISGSKKTWDVSNQVVTHWLKENDFLCKKSYVRGVKDYCESGTTLPGFIEWMESDHFHTEFE